MKIIPLNDENGYRCLAVEVDWSEVAADYDDIITAYSRVQIPGFRPGRVPRGVIEQRLQKQVLEDLVQRLIPRLGREAVRESDTESLGPIEVRDVECAKGATFRFTARFWPMPEIELPDLDLLTPGDDGSDMRDGISKTILEQVRFTVPEELIKAELGDDETESCIGSDGWKAASDRVRLMLTLKRIAAQEGIDVSEKEVEQRIKDKAFEFGIDTEALRSELEEGGGTQRLKDMLLAESTLDYLLERLTQKKGELR